MIELQECPTEIQTCQEKKKKYVCYMCGQEIDINKLTPSRIKYSIYCCKKCEAQKEKKRRDRKK